MFILIYYTENNLYLERRSMRKQIIAFLAAVLITGMIALPMAVVGAAALTNRNSVPVSNSPSTSAAANAPVSTDAQAQIAQLQDQVAQYQAALQQADAQLNQAASQVQMIQQLLIYLENQGLIQIDSQGHILVTGSSGN
jgi:peptidoglycan hydrolase CwlO-like protein